MVCKRNLEKAGGGMDNTPQYVIEMLHITKEFPGIKANDDITLQLKRARSMHCWAKTARANPR